MQGGIGRMLTMTQVHDIRKLYLEEGKNISQISKATGFEEEGRMKKQYAFDERFIDGIFLGILNPDFKGQRKS